MAKRDVEHLRRLDAFCAASGSLPDDVIFDAVRAYINSRLAADCELRSRYIQKRANITGRMMAKIARVVKR